MMPAKYTHEQRVTAFWAKVDKNGPVPSHRPELGPCWIWTAFRDRHEYGRVTYRPFTWFAHRFSYTTVFGPIPDGLTIDHLCRVHPCVNPAHLETVTRRVNTLRGATLAATYAARTACNYGHPLREAGPKKSRICPTCKSIDARRRYVRRKAGG